LTPAQIVNAAVEEGVRIVGLSILSGSHKPRVAAVIEGLKTSGIGDVPVVVGGIIPPEDAAALKAAGVAAVYPPKDFDLNAIMAVIVAIVVRGARRAA
jgi:ethylmalonyl-CoA mutase